MHKKTILIILFFSISVCSISAFTQERDRPPVEFRKISDRLYMTTGGAGAQGGVYIGDNGVVIIDSKYSRESVEQVLENIRKLTDLPVKYLINTHSDRDHIIGNRFFPDPVTFVAHENCRKEFFHPLRDGSSSGWEKPEYEKCIPSVTFKEKMDLYLGSKKIELWHFGTGHTTGDCVVYFPQEKTAFIGDQIFLTRQQLIHSYKGGNSFGHVKNLIKMLDTLDADTFCSGHSEPATRTQVLDHIYKMRTMQENIRSQINQGKNLEEIKAVYGEDYARLAEVIYNEIKGE